uniref:Cystatin n=1 Tax=Caenorhabditis japonica TaxID=281687 RepID=A0A8R1HVJ9_CAEJA
MKSSLFITVFIIFATIGNVIGQIVGGLNDVDPAQYEPKAWQSVPEINTDNVGEYLWIPIEITKAQVQVVAGKKIVLEVLVGDSDCPRDRKLAVSDIPEICHVSNEGDRQLFQVDIWEKPWENFENITVTKIRDVKQGEVL